MSRLLPLVCLVLLWGCVPQTPAKKEPLRVALPPAPVPTQVPPAAPPQTPAPATSPAPATTPVRAFDESLLRGREFLLEIPPTGRLVVRDPDLGALSEERALVQAVEDFLQDAEDGNLDHVALVGRWETYLKAWAMRFHGRAKEWGKVRVGQAISEPGAGWLVPVKLTGTEGVSYTGWVGLASNGTGYLISDIQMAETTPRTGPFDPESSGQEISSPNLR